MWRHGDEAAYLAVYALGDDLTGPWQIDLVSILSKDPPIGLTTGTTKDGHTQAPPSGSYLQSFSGRTVGQLWALHAEGEAYVADRHGIDPQPVTLANGGQALAWWLVRAANDRIRHPGRELATPWRFWVGRHLCHNKTVAALYGR